MIRARISDNFYTLGIAVTIVMTDGDRTEPRHIMRFEATGKTPHCSWESLPNTPATTEPTLTLTHEVARAMLDALLCYYEGASDMHTARQDLLHERGRVDKLTDALIATTALPLRSSHLRD